MSVRIKNQIGDTGSYFFKLLKIVTINYPIKTNMNSLALEYLRLKINILQKISVILPVRKTVNNRIQFPTSGG